jgi:hypothetical protein
LLSTLLPLWSPVRPPCTTASPAQFYSFSYAGILAAVRGAGKCRNGADRPMRGCYLAQPAAASRCNRLASAGPR